LSRPDFKLYLITDRKIAGRNLISFENACEEALKGGVKAIQLREKDMPVRELLALAKKMRALTKRYAAKLFINGRVDVALASGADGVHLGGDSIPPKAARKIAGGLMIGASTHSMEEANRAEEGGADFITMGPVYETPSKMKYGEPIGIEKLRECAREVPLPVFALGGIKKENAEEAMEAGAGGIALISAILGAEDIKKETEEFMRITG
jgi:thiamine-phosphate pyrophosphorylase